MKKHLESSEFIDWRNEYVYSKAKELSKGCSTDVEISCACFEWVRDEIKHSHDYSLNPVTCKASEVLKYQTGYCYAKSHLLAALLRANDIPAGLCYQRLSINGKGAPFCMHGLNAVHLNEYGWYLIDARGNKEGVNAEFTPPEEKLAFQILLGGEYLVDEIYSEPLKEVIATLTSYKTEKEVWMNLPDFTESKHPTNK